MSDTDYYIPVCFSPPVAQQIDDWLGGFYGGFIDKHTFDEIESALAGALESEGVPLEDVRRAVRRHGFSHLDRAVAHQLAAEAGRIAQDRSGMGFC